MARKGLPKSIIKKYGISKKAWAVFRGKKRKRSNPRPKKKARKVRRKVARRKRRRRSGMTIPVAPLIGFAGPILEAYSKWGPTVDAVNYYSQSMTGYDFIGGTFDIQRAKRGLMPLVIGMLIHKFVGGAPLNLNRTLAASKIPFLRI